MTTDRSTVDPIVQQVLEEAHRALQEMYGNRLLHVILYGSQARGDAREDSDVDVLVVLKGEIRPGKEIRRVTEITVDMLARYEKFLSFHLMSEHEYHRVTPLLMNVQEDGVVL